MNTTTSTLPGPSGAPLTPAEAAKANALASPPEGPRARFWRLREVHSALYAMALGDITRMIARDLLPEGVPADSVHVTPLRDGSLALVEHVPPPLRKD